MIAFTQMGSMTDGIAVNACVASGMCVIVQVEGDLIAGIVSAHTSTHEAWAAFEPVRDDDFYAMVVPTEAGPELHHDFLLSASFFAACRR